MDSPIKNKTEKRLVRLKVELFRNFLVGLIKGIDLWRFPPIPLQNLKY